MANLLIIDDDLDVRDYLATVAIRLGHHVVLAVTCAEARAKFAETDIEIIIAEIFLPDSPDQDEWVENLKQHAAGRHLILITGEPTEELAAKAKAAGILGFLTKPFELAFVKNLLGQATDNPPRNPTEPMIDKTKLGIPFFDERFGGIYRKRSALCIGRQGSGKTIAALQALLQSVRQGERGLMLSAWPARDLIIIADHMGLQLTDTIARGQITLLEYAHIMPLPEFEQNRTLPPGSFMEFQNIIEAGGISRVVIDTILPWVAISQKDKLDKHVYSFIQAIERMGVTAILTIPSPVSPLAHVLKNYLEQQIPVVFTLDRDENGKYTLLLNKYEGKPTLPPPIPFIITRGAGLLRAPKIIPEKVPAPAPRAQPGETPIRFSSAIHT